MCEFWSEIIMSKRQVVFFKPFGETSVMAGFRYIVTHNIFWCLWMLKSRQLIMLSLYVSRVKCTLGLRPLSWLCSHYISYDSSKTDINTLFTDFGHIPIHIFQCLLHLHIFSSTVFLQSPFTCQYSLYSETCNASTVFIHIACRTLSTLLLNPLTFMYFY